MSSGNYSRSPEVGGVVLCAEGSRTCAMAKGLDVSIAMVSEIIRKNDVYSIISEEFYGHNEVLESFRKLTDAEQRLLHEELRPRYVASILAYC